MNNLGLPIRCDVNFVPVVTMLVLATKNVQFVQQDMPHPPEAQIALYAQKVIMLLKDLRIAFNVDMVTSRPMQVKCNVRPAL